MAAEIDQVFGVTFLLTGGMFVLVTGILLVALFRFRHRPGGSDGEGTRARYNRGSWRHELLWASVPAILLLALAALSETTWARMRPTRAGSFPPDALHVDVLAQQYAWHVRYAGPDGRMGQTDPKLCSESNPFGLVEGDAAAADDVVTMNELYLPTGRPVRFTLRSRDVIHGFYIPAFRLQQNVLPGAALDFWLRPTRPGRYEAVCNQFCGLAHYRMRADVTVGAEEEMAGWLASRGGGGESRNLRGGDAAP